MKYNLVLEKSTEFAIRAIKLYQYLSENKKEYVLSKQLLRSGTSIGANVKEGINAMSKREFVSKLNISLKEANETEYWLGLLYKTGYIKEKEYISIKDECVRIIKIITAILKSATKTIDKK